MPPGGPFAAELTRSLLDTSRNPRHLGTVHSVFARGRNPSITDAVSQATQSSTVRLNGLIGWSVPTHVSTAIPARNVEWRSSTPILEPAPSRASLASGVWLALVLAAASMGCSDSPTSDGPSISIGAALPFTGIEAAMGRNLEQAMILAVEDVNQAGGIDGVPLKLISRDSNSGSERGLNELLKLLYEDGVDYLIGPEENNLASQVVADVKGLDVLHILPGYASPNIKRSSTSGAWLRLAPSSHDIACGLASHAVDDGANKANVLASLEDYNASVSTNFISLFRAAEGTPVPSVSVESGQSSYASPLKRVFNQKADRTLLVAYPATAATIVTEWTVLGKPGFWYLSPLLHADVFLSNIPYGALDGQFGVSPSLSLTSECELLEGYTYGSIECTRDNSERFVSHFAQRWDGAKPFAAAHLYYDAVVLLAMGMAYAVATEGDIPTAKPLQKLIRSLNAPDNDEARWTDLDEVLPRLAQGEALRYVGAGAEYNFNEYGSARHKIFDTWTIRRHAFVDTGVYYASCIDPL